MIRFLFSFGALFVHAPYLIWPTIGLLPVLASLFIVCRRLLLLPKDHTPFTALACVLMWAGLLYESLVLGLVRALVGQTLFAVPEYLPLLLFALSFVFVIMPIMEKGKISSIRSWKSGLA